MLPAIRQHKFYVLAPKTTKNMETHNLFIVYGWMQQLLIEDRMAKSPRMNEKQTWAKLIKRHEEINENIRSIYTKTEIPNMKIKRIFQCNCIIYTHHSFNVKQVYNYGDNSQFSSSYLMVLRGISWNITLEVGAAFFTSSFHSWGCRIFFDGKQHNSKT